MTAVLCPVLIGRDAELQALRIALSRALAGDGRLVTVAGEAGIGKSRLVREITVEARATPNRATVLVGRAAPGGVASPYRPLTEALLAGLRDHPLPDADWPSPGSRTQGRW